ncbi:ABC transporter ATP-binding protein [Fusibacter sp. 3D3]|uniref:ABC transporter ATP-binding protein n=1 Tax=Fusibacter sp. 3D3 TaxID=1048380 RepID=UPI00085343C2|nr:ABC transporter ATP-binding protein [Fusibacter sp. 3D3]GAU76668.1 oligopeptide transport system permease protein OppB [Fusibacter sp. 3D3]
MNTIDTILQMKDLTIDIKIDEGTLNVVRGVQLDIKRNETLGLVGESGCGKSLTSKSILGINNKKCNSKGEILFQLNPEKSVDMLKLNPNGKAIKKIRGKEISMIFQEPLVAFSPLYTIGNQINECTRLHVTKDKVKSKALSIEMMEKVGIANASKRYDQYPHEFSGGMLQRAMIAMSLVSGPKLLIADEPTTALDVTIQAQILDLMNNLKKEMGMSILFITHDLGTVAKMCDRVAVMYLGKIVELAPVRSLYKTPLHPYTNGLLGSVHRIGTSREKRLYSIEGTVPLALNLPKGCGFYDRCPKKIKGICNQKQPELREKSEGHFVACFACEHEEAKHE